MKKKVAILINDIHLNKDNGVVVKDVIAQAVRYAKEKGVRNIIFGGDVFTNRSGQPLQCLIDFKQILVEYLDGFNIYLIPGNHDKTNPDDYVSYLDVFAGYRRVTLCQCGSVINMEGVDVVLMPYFSEPKWLAEFKAVQTDLDFDKPTILITHMAIEGVKNNDGTEVESELKTKMFAKFDNVLVGHYHNASKVAENIYYTGSAYQANFGENVTDKGFAVIYADGSFESVRSVFPTYIKHEIDVTDKETLQNLLEKYDGEDYNHIRFVFRGSKQDCQKINIAEIQGKYGIDCKFVNTDEVEAVNFSIDDSVSSYDKKSLTKDFISFCSENGIKGERLKQGMNLLKEIKYVESN